MKILRIFGIVAAVHLFAFVFVMANPGCSTKSKASSPAGPAGVAQTEEPSPFSPAPVAGAGAAADSSEGLRFSPSRPGMPSAAAAASEKPDAELVPATTVTVAAGDSLWSIARRHKIPVTELAAANNLKTRSVLKVGQKLVVPGQSAPSVVMSTAAEQPAVAVRLPQAATEESAPEKNGKARAGTATHVVRSGETLGSIARKYGVKAADIAIANNITNPAMIPAGKSLTIPLPKSKSPAVKQPQQTAGSGVGSEQVSQPARQPEAAVLPVERPATTPLVMPVIGDAPASNDLDAGLPSSGSNSVPVIQVEDANAPRM